MNTPNHTPEIVTSAPKGFTSFTRSVFKSEKRALAAARKRSSGGYVKTFVVYEPATHMTNECWIVGYVPVGP